MIVEKIYNVERRIIGGRGGRPYGCVDTGSLGLGRGGNLQGLTGFVCSRAGLAR